MALYLIAWSFVIAFAAIAAGRKDDGGPWVGIWTGLAAFVLIAGALSIVLPSWAVWVALGVMGCGAVFVTARRGDLVDLSGWIPRKTGWIVVAILGLAIAYLASRFPIYFDTAFYHLQMARIADAFGTLPGAALLHPNLGQVSLWFGAAGSFLFGDDAALGVGFLNGLFAFAAALHAAAAIRDILMGRRDAATVIPAVAHPITLFLALRWDMLASLSPDFPVMVLTVVLGWALCLERRPVGLALLAVTAACLIKISAAPLAVVVGIWALITWRPTPGRLLVWAIPVLIAAGLASYGSVMASGCIVYPVAFTCLDVPWGMSDAAVRAHATLISSAAFGGGLIVDADTSPWERVLVFIRDDVSGAAVVAQFVLAIAVAATGGAKRRHWAFWLAAIGGAFVLATAPTGRFLAGPAAVAAGLAVARLLRLRADISLDRPILAAGTVYALLLITAMATAPGADLREALRDRHWPTPLAERFDGLLAPTPVLAFEILADPPVAASRFTAFSNGEITLTGATPGTECWALAPPCAMRGVPDALRLADPSKGIAGGFILGKP